MYSYTVHAVVPCTVYSFTIQMYTHVNKYTFPNTSYTLSSDTRMYVDKLSVATDFQFRISVVFLNCRECDFKLVPVSAPSTSAAITAGASPSKSTTSGAPRDCSCAESISPSPRPPPFSTTTVATSSVYSITF